MLECSMACQACGSINLKNDENSIRFIKIKKRSFLVSPEHFHTCLMKLKLKIGKKRSVVDSKDLESKYTFRNSYTSKTFYKNFINVPDIEQEFLEDLENMQ